MSLRGFFTGGCRWEPTIEGRMRATLADGSTAEVWRRDGRVVWSNGHLAGISHEPSLLFAAWRLAVEARMQAARIAP